MPASLNAIFESRLLEVMTVPLPDARWAFCVAAAAEQALERSARVQSLVLGPGPRAGARGPSVRARAGAAGTLPLLLDADGLNAHAGRARARSPARSAPTVLTPHAGELGRLLGDGRAPMSRHTGCAARARGRRAANAIVVLKGDDTIVAEPDGRVGVSRGGAPALATAGTGDVLSGVIGAYLAKSMDPFHAACAGVFVHVVGRAASRRAGSAPRA